MLETQKLLSAIKPLMGFSNSLCFFMFRVKNDGISFSNKMAILSLAFLPIVVGYKLWIMSHYSFSVFFQAVFKITDILFFSLVIFSHLNYVVHGKSIVKTWNNMIKYADFVTGDSYYKKAFRITCSQMVVVHAAVFLHIVGLLMSNLTREAILQQVIHMFFNHFLLSHFIGTNILFADSIHFGRKIISLVNEELLTLQRIEHYRNIPTVSGVVFVKRYEIARLRSTMKMMQNENIYSLIDIYMEICESCSDLNELFGISLAVGWLYDLLELVLYCFLMTAIDSSKIPLFLVWVFYYLISNWALLDSCERFTKEAMKTRLLLNSLTTENSSIVLKEAVQRFSLSLLHRKVKFTACNLFNLDYKFFYSALSSIITYFVIFVQFYRQ